jgi:hypothetical protein
MVIIYALPGRDERGMEINKGSFVILDPAKNVNYGREDIPSTRDGQIRELLLRVGEQRSFDTVGGLVPQDAATVLNVFAERAATIAVRHRDAREIHAGLVAAAIALTLDGDAREAIPALALLYRAAEMIGHDPNFEFAAADELCGGRASVLMEFSRRAPVDRSIEAMGYEEGEDKHGFRFMRNW